MQFDSFYFILYFIPAVVILYYTLGRLHVNARKLVFIISSVAFLVINDIYAVEMLFISLIVNYTLAFAVRKNKKLVCIPVIVNVGLLIYFKYTDFIIDNINSFTDKAISISDIILPLGISFFTFSQIAYSVAVSKGDIDQIKLLDYLAYVTYFPKFLMGPIMEPVDYINQLNNDEIATVNWDNIACGIKLFSFGLFKKVILADTFAKPVAWIYTQFDYASSVDWLLIVLFYTFEIYFDFSGYSDMATGVSLLFNIQLPINFDSPYKATSIRDFWKRWHISLTKFFTKYVYIPLGGSKKGIVITCTNIMIVFLVSGMWHGANWTFLVWGAVHGIICLFDRLVDYKVKINKVVEVIRRVLTFAAVNVLWLLFNSRTVGQFVTVVTTIARHESLIVSDELMNHFMTTELKILGFNGLASMLVYIIVAALICFVPQNNYRTMKKIDAKTMVVTWFAFIMSLISLGIESVFIYNGF